MLVNMVSLGVTTDNVILVIPDGNYIIRREENFSAIQCLLLLVQVGQTINEPGSKIL